MAEHVGKYSIELFREGGEGAGIETVLVRHDSLAVSRALFKAAADKHPGRLVMLCDRARVLARSDRPETWTDAWTKERLIQAAIDELVRHGGNQRDAQQLQAEIQKAYENKPQDEDSSRQAGDIPD
jgi:hypothetical protein